MLFPSLLLVKVHLLYYKPAFAGGDNGLQVVSIGIGDKTFVPEHMQIFHAY
jgi:hypothetical protein